MNKQIQNDYKISFLCHSLTLAGTAEENLSNTLASAKVDLNPHQIEAALFAIKNPLSRGVILADEVGLGKTIEASLVIAQNWAERKRKILLIVPSMLRGQWLLELKTKFNIPSKVLDSQIYKSIKKDGLRNPFQADGEYLIICSYEFAAKKHIDFQNIKWDLVVFDEAHKLRNIWKKQGAKIAKTLNISLQGRKKLLLSATPLQNSLLELYGLIYIIDPLFFGSLDSFKSKFVGSKTSSENVYQIKKRISNICMRNLRRQVQISQGLYFTKRHSFIERYDPYDDEKFLYEKVSSFLQRDDIVSIKPGAKHLTTLIIRKILSSSTFALSATLQTICNRLENNSLNLSENLYDLEITEETDYEIDKEQKPPIINKFKLKEEIEEIKSFKEIARNIKRNSKGDTLLKVLEKAFSKVQELGGQKKVVIFTESRRTQEYLYEILSKKGYEGKIVILNGNNSDKKSLDIYHKWLILNNQNHSGSKSIDMKSAIIDEFKNNASILISTETGAEGVNMQFCSFLINYDLPWNPQRIEQRIGRIHRYGQKSDVVVMNFLNNANKADQLLFEILERKFKLFDGIFGASDEILGAIENEISLEKRVNQIMQKCRHVDEIEKEFMDLNSELQEIINKREKNTQKKLLENFDEEVIACLKSRNNKTELALNEYGQKLRNLCRELFKKAEHYENNFIFNGQNYYFDWKNAQENNGFFLTKESEIIKKQVEKGKTLKLVSKELTFEYKKYGRQLADIKNLIGKKGWIKLSKLTIDSVDKIEKLLFIGITEEGNFIDSKQCERILMIPITEKNLLTKKNNYQEEINTVENKLIKKHISDTNLRNEIYFNTEQEKLDCWAEDTKNSIDIEIKNLDLEIKNFKKISRTIKSLNEKTKALKEIKKIEKRRDEKMLSYFETRKKIEKKTDQLLNEIESKLKLTYRIEEIFCIFWKLI